MTQSITTDLRSFSNWPTQSTTGSKRTEDVAQRDRLSTNGSHHTSLPVSSTQPERITGQEMHDLFQTLLAMSDHQAAEIDTASVERVQKDLQTGNHHVDLDRLAQQLLKTADL